MDQISGHVDPCKTDTVKGVHQAALHHLACPRQRKTPLSKKVLKKLRKLLTTGKLADLQTLTLITLGFAGCLWWDDLSHTCVDGFKLCLYIETIWLNYCSPGRTISSEKAAGCLLAYEAVAWEESKKSGTLCHIQERERERKDGFGVSRRRSGQIRPAKSTLRRRLGGRCSRST